MLGSKFYCPSCGAILTIAKPLPAGTPIKCARCATIFSLSTVVAPSAAAVQEPSSPALSFAPAEGVVAQQQGSSPTLTFTPERVLVGQAAAMGPTMSFTPEPALVASQAMAERSPRKPVKKKTSQANIAIGFFALLIVGLVVGGVVYVTYFMAEPQGVEVRLGNQPSRPAVNPESKQPQERAAEAPEEEPEEKQQRRRPVFADGTPWLGVGVGNRALEIDGEDFDGKHFRLSEYKGKVVLLDFWGNWCPYCRQMYPYEQALVKRLADKPFVLLGVNNDRSRAAVKQIIQKEQLGWRSWWDGQSIGMPISRQWNVHSWPTMVLIDHEGVIRHKIEGVPEDNAAFDKIIDKLVAQVENKGKEEKTNSK